MKNGKNNMCPLTAEIVSYMYGELRGPAEYDFETHLADCTDCTDEFAAVSESRYSVFEWRKEVFDPLPTPLFAIPNGLQPSKAEAGFMAGVVAWMQTLSAPVAVAAAIFVVAGVWLIVFTLGKKQEPSVATGNTPQLVQPETKPNVVSPAQDHQLPPDLVEIKSPSRKAVKPVAVSAIQPRRVVRPRAMIAEKTPAENLTVAPSLQKAPALTAYQENEDRSLRLAELFDEVGG